MRPAPDRILDYREFPVLYVDDEAENLRIFELSFRREFSILVAETAEEALGILNTQPVAIVLSDQRMPGMVGTEFLARVAEVDPKTVRVLVTAYGDAGTLESAINSGSIYRFIPKPWTPEDMRLTVRRGIEVYALDREREQLVRELTILNRVSKQINQELEYDSLLNLLVETVTDVLGYDAAGILINDQKREELIWSKFAPECDDVCRDLRGLRITEQGAPAFFSKLLEGRTQTFRSANLLDLEGPVRRWITEVAAEETLVIPLLGKDSLVGALFVDNRRGGKAFTSEDRTLIEGLAYQAVIAIENARLVDDLKKSRQQVMRTERLGTLGTLAAGLAHEINNPLVSIRTFLSMAPAKRMEDDPEFWGDYHSLATNEVERIRRLVETMRQLGRDGAEEAPREAINLEEIVNQVLRLVERESVRKGASLRSEIAAGLPSVLAARDQIHQLVMNLLLNALYAAGEEGSIALKAYFDEEDDSILIEVSDNGVGIAPEDLERIFDPFFTTKGPDEGTGLGLMICHRIVAEHMGSIEVKSRQGEGTAFLVRLPRNGVEAERVSENS